MDQILIFINNWGTIIAGILTASGTIYLFAKKCMKKLKPHLEILENLKKLTNTVDIIYKEFRPNSGSSLVDKLAQVSKDVKENTELTKRIEKRQIFRENLSSVPTFETSSDGSCVFVNDAYASLVQRPKSEILGNGWILCILEENREEVLKEWNEAISRRRNFERTISILDKNNQEYLVKCIAIRQEETNGYLGYYSNVTKA
jgi:PAS domain-containing protein